MNGTALLRVVAASAATALTTLALPAFAGAADYCVGQNLGCDDPHTVQSLDHALDKADDADDADRILLGPGIHMPSNGLPFMYNRADAPVEIVGQGTGQTVLTRSILSSGSILSLYGGPGSSVRDLTLRVPAGVENSFTALMTSATARRIEVIEDSTQTNQRSGVALFGGTLEDSTVMLDGEDETRGVRFFEAPGTLRRSTVSAQIGVYSRLGGTVERSRVTGTRTGVTAYQGTTTVTGSVIRFGSFGSGNGIHAEAVAGSDTTVNADGVTIICSPCVTSSPGVLAVNGVAPDQDVHVNLANSVLRTKGVPLTASTAAGASGHVSIAASYSDYKAGSSHEGNSSITESNVSNVGEAGFVDAAGGDYHLLPSSALIDTGDPATGQGVDLDGNPLVADGNADGMARRDPGAYERPAPGEAPQAGDPPPAGGTLQTGLPVLDTQAPLITGFRVTRTQRSTRFRYTLSEPVAVTVKIQRAIRGSRTRYRTIGTLTRTGASGANSIRVSGRLAKRVRISGRYRVRIAATDKAGNRAAPKLARWRVGSMS